MSRVLTGKVALITGSSRGIGRAIAIKLASMGAKVGINYRRRYDEAKKTLEIIKENGGEGEIFKADVSKKEDVKTLVEKIRSNLGPITILVNNVGLGIASPFLEMSEKHWDKQIEVSLKSVFLVTREVLNDMINEKWGRIINISSIAGIKGLKYLSAYSAAKAGVIALSKVLAMELAEYGITVNVIAPGFVNTDMAMSFFQWLKDRGEKEPLKKFLKWGTLTHQLVEPETIAEIVGYLVLPTSSNITGQLFIIDSGENLALSSNLF